MFTKGLATIIKSLNDKKYREKTGLFLVEGEKSIAETLASDFEIKTLLTTKAFYSKYSALIKSKNINYEIVEAGEIEKVGNLETNDSALAIVKQKKFKEDIPPTENQEIIIALDNIRDPGNFGTIIRIADWYNIKKIVASIGTVDFYNPKVIAATKGSFTRVEVIYSDLKGFFAKVKLPVIGAFLKGENIHTFRFPSAGILLIGNESNGIGPELEKNITHKVTIPAGKINRTDCAESLNAAIATAIIVDNWQRNII